ncbi:hypothetical protein [Brevibacillus daliensis]|uniref:hypothetical protein n=1 Tax=Brevibacillus daliensis TaxID=2892995 RepID=UPI001E29C4A1|nr:hypothetical protein [Brevibacillus daliensis]
MSKPFDSFVCELSGIQVHLLLDTVSYFEEAPKYLSLPNQQGEAISVPLLADALRTMLEAAGGEDELEKKAFSFDFEWTDEDKQTGILLITLPDGKVIKQDTTLTDFSMV